MSTYLDESRPLVYCPGCGHPHVLRALDQALEKLALPPAALVVVSDIGCVGLADAYFPTLSTVHSLHGRSVAVALGLSLGRLAAAAPAIKPIVLIGDGGAGIGLIHLVHAAQMDAAVTVIVHNNLVYGMTGGQHSGLTPEGMKTTTTPGGSPLRPLDLLAILAGAGAGFLARAVAPSDELAPLVAAAIRHPGFACIEVLELCPTFATRIGGVTGATLRALPGGEHGGGKLGVLVSREAGAGAGAGAHPAPRLPIAPAPADEAVVPDPALGKLDRRVQLVVAGRAGERVQSAALVAARAAAAAGLHATVRTDNPVTQGTGFSLAELTVAPEPIAYTGLSEPDAVIVLAPEGERELAARGWLTGPGGARRYVIDAEIAPPEGLAVEVERPRLRATHGGKLAALAALVGEVRRHGWWADEAWRRAAAALPAAQRADLDRVLGG